MIEYIKGFFTKGDTFNILGKVLIVLAISLFVYLSFYYAKKRNLNWLIGLEIAVILALFVIGLLGIDNYKFYVLFVMFGITIANFVFFAQDMSRDLFRKSLNSSSAVHSAENIGREELRSTVDSIVRACQNLSKSDTGALIIIADSISDAILDSGTRIGSDVSSDLLETIFFPKTPLHDGAVVISATQIVSAGCYLPLTQQLDLPREFGTRHRAAIGITDNRPDITAIVVSEESGIISAMRDGKIQRYLDADGLKNILELALHLISNENIDRVWGGKTQL